MNEQAERDRLAWLHQWERMQQLVLELQGEAVAYTAEAAHMPAVRVQKWCQSALEYVSTRRAEELVTYMEHY